MAFRRRRGGKSFRGRRGRRRGLHKGAGDQRVGFRM